MMEKSTSVSSKAKSSEGSNASSPLVELQETLSSIFQKRTRALRKKVRNVEEIERKVQDGKEINDQQEEAIRSKGTTLSLLEEVERLRKAIEEEVQKTIATEEAEAKKMKRKKKREEKLAAAKEEEEKAKGLLELEKKKKKKQKEKEEKDKLQATAAAAAVESSKDSTSKNASNNLDQAIEKLLKVFYFGRLFDTSMGNTLAHYERAAYLGYDGLMKSEPAPGLMTQKHLDGLAAFAYYLSSRPMNQLLSHKQALDQCVALAKEFLDETKEKKMEVPLPDGTFCDLEAMIDRVTLTGFFSAVPQLQSFGDFSNNNNLQQPSGTPAAAADDMTGGLLNTNINTNTNTNIKIDNATHDTTTMVNSWEESQSVQPALISMPVAQNQSQQGFAPPEHQPQHQHRNAAHMEGGAVQKEMVKMTNGSEKKFQPRQKKTGQKGPRGPNRDHRAAANQSQSHEQAHVNQNVPALTEMDANQHQPASVNANYKKSANKRERSNNNNNLNKKATAGAGPGETGNPKKTLSNKEGDLENKGTTRKNWNRSSGPRQRQNGSNIRKGNGSKRDNPKQPPVSIK